MNETQLGTKIDYLVSCRDRNDRDLARTIRKLITYLMAREKIPLDPVDHPDRLQSDLILLKNVSVLLLERLIIDNPLPLGWQQLSLSFEREDA